MKTLHLPCVIGARYRLFCSQKVTSDVVLLQVLESRLAHVTFVQLVTCISRDEPMSLAEQWI